MFKPSSTHNEVTVARGQKVTLPNGLPFFCMDSREMPGMYREVFEEEVYAKHGLKLSPNMTIFDVGANAGMVALYLSGKCPSARIFCFEPLPPTYSVLNANVKLHGLSNVSTRNFGLADKAQTAQFDFYPFASGCSTMHPFASKEFLTLLRSDIKNHDRHPLWLRLALSTPILGRLLIETIVYFKMRHEKHTCHLRTLSETIQEEKIQSIDLLKIDVERAELQVLKGISEQDWPKIKQAVIEVQDDLDPQTSVKVKQLLQEKGFQTTQTQAGYLLRPDGTSLNGTIYATRPAFH